MVCEDWWLITPVITVPSTLPANGSVGRLLQPFFCCGFEERKGLLIKSGLTSEPKPTRTIRRFSTKFFWGCGNRFHQPANPIRRGHRVHPDRSREPHQPRLTPRCHRESTCLLQHFAIISAVYVVSRTLMPNLCKGHFAKLSRKPLVIKQAIIPR